MILKLFIPNVSETHALNNPTLAVWGKTNCSPNSVSERRDLYK